MAVRKWQTVLQASLDSKFMGNLNKAQKALKGYKLGVGAADRANTMMGRSSRSMSRSVFTGIAGFAAAYLSVQTLTAGYHAMSKATQENIASSTRLNTMMMNVKGARMEDVKALAAQSEALQKYTTIDADVSKWGASQLASFQLQGKSIKTLLPALADLAVGTHGINVNNEQMQQSANLLGKVFTGQVGALRRVGVSFDKNQEKILKNGTEQQKVAMLTKVIGQNYGNLARKMANTPEGRIIQLKNAWGLFPELLGKRLLPMLTKVLNYLGPRLEGYIERGAKGFDKFVTKLEKWGPVFMSIYEDGVKLFNFLRRNWGWLGPIIEGVITTMLIYKAVTMGVELALKLMAAAQWLVNIAMNANPVGLIILGLSILIGVIITVVRHWDKVRAALAAAWTWFVKFGTEGPGRFIPLIALIAAIAKNWDKVTAGAKAAFAWIAKIADRVKGIKWPWGGKDKKGPAPGSPSITGHARGGIVGKPVLSWLGERNKREAVIPLDQHRDRARSLWRQAGNAIDAGGSSTNVTFAPVIHAAPGTDVAAIEKALARSVDQLKRDLAALQSQERRRALA